jgi:AraC-like DNA-binding protein
VNSDNQTPVEWRRIFHTRDVEAIRALLSATYQKDFAIAPARRGSRNIDLSIDGFDLPNMFLHHLRFATGVALESSRSDGHYVICLPLSGRAEASAGGTSIACNPHSAVIFCRPATPASMVRTEAPMAALNLTISQGAVMRQLAALLGEPVDTAPEFASTLDLTQGHGGNLARYLLLALRDFRQADQPPWTPIMIGGFEDFIISKLLVSHPHSYSSALRKAEKPIAPRDVRRAMDYMEARLGAAITIADVAGASGIAGRTLFKHFRDFHGMSPMQHLRNSRFDKVREALVRADPEQSVTEIAMNWGFTHMGRFAVEYRQRFGESPSESLRRVRAPRCVRV